MVHMSQKQTLYFFDNLLGFSFVSVVVAAAVFAFNAVASVVAIVFSVVVEVAPIELDVVAIALPVVMGSGDAAATAKDAFVLLVATGVIASIVFTAVVGWWTAVQYVISVI